MEVAIIEVVQIKNRADVPSSPARRFPFWLPQSLPPLPGPGHRSFGRSGNTRFNTSLNCWRHSCNSTSFALIAINMAMDREINTPKMNDSVTVSLFSTDDLRQQR